jgi:hypothetical protein
MSETGKSKSRDLTKHPDFYDYLKHLTTLSTGSVVLLATFAEKFPKDAAWRSCLPISMASLLLSVLSSVTSMFFALSCQRYGDEDPPEWETTTVLIALLIAAATLLTGLLAVGGFTIKNF